MLFCVGGKIKFDPKVQEEKKKTGQLREVLAFFN
jgi:hypothetical protein